MHGQAAELQADRRPVRARTDEYARLVEAVALSRDREAFSRLFEYFAPRLKAWLMRAGAPAGAAEDFAQDAMLTVWRKADLFDPARARRRPGSSPSRATAAWTCCAARGARPCCPK